MFGREMLVDFSGGENGILLKDANTCEQFQIKRIESKAGPADTSDPPHPKASPTNLRERKCKFKSTTNNSVKSKISDNDKKSKEKSEKSMKGNLEKRKLMIKQMKKMRTIRVKMVLRTKFLFHVKNKSWIKIKRRSKKWNWKKNQKLISNVLI
uniref:Uncharacterized protein n=1 Tax=Meloidogyne enterolobii TaxID=390850 RepID=A0A6V7XTD3_MELEN|nr:unnamed protein product [Meloidogyne enterolobii]